MKAQLWKIKPLIWLILTVFIAGFLVPESHNIPVAHATRADWNAESFWYYPWGVSGTHKGIDIFAQPGTSVQTATSGLVIATGNNERGGNYVLILGAKWRCYYYAHLQNISTALFQPVRTGDVIGTVGNTGNAQGKPAHLHFTIRSLIPLPWHYDSRKPQAWLKLFYINPNDFLLSKD